jgi:electron transfer flavoprotein alpha subunit
MSDTIKLPRKPRGKARLIEGKCIACGARCESACSSDAIVMNDAGAPIIDPAACTGCVKCVKVCPAKALEMAFTPEERRILEQIAAATAAASAPASSAPSAAASAPASSAPSAAASAAPATETVDAEAEALGLKLAAYRGVWVFVEQTEGEPAKVSWELLGVGRELARSLAVDVSAVVVGSGVAGLCGEAFAYGADRVYLVDQPVFRHYRTAPYLEAVCRLVEKHKPEIVLMGATGLGRDLAGAVATRLGTGLTADCTGLSIDAKRMLMQTRPAFGGNIMATIMCDRFRPQMATVRPHVMPLPARQPGRTGAVVRESVPVREEDILVKVLDIVRTGSAGNTVDISAAEFIVSGGRGVGGREHFGILQELAGELGGVVGASRSAVDAGWMPPERQVGQTGKTVRPKIYIACGISGAVQHIVGMQDSEMIIAINRDREAPIFDVATYGIVGDLFEIVPALTRRLRQVRAERTRFGERVS